MVDGHKSAAHTDSLDGGTGKTCVGGGMHCPSASSYYGRYAMTLDEAVQLAFHERSTV